MTSSHVEASRVESSRNKNDNELIYVYPVPTTIPLTIDSSSNIREILLDYLKCFHSNRQQNGLFDLFDLFKDHMTIQYLLIIYSIPI